MGAFADVGFCQSPQPVSDTYRWGNVTPGYACLANEGWFVGGSANRGGHGCSRSFVGWTPTLVPLGGGRVEQGLQNSIPLVTANTPIPAFPNQFELCEGPLWDGTTESLWWVDITQGQLWTGSVDGTARLVHQFESTVGAVALGDDGRMVCAAGARIVALDREGNEEDIARLPLVGNARANDGQVDPAGRLIVGSFDDEVTLGGAYLWQVDRGEVTLLKAGLTVPNGIGWSLDAETMYFIDSADRAVYRMSYELETGAIGEFEVLADVSEFDGVPDGLAVDARGFIWVGFWDGGVIRVFAPEGQLERTIDTGASRTTSCCFGGPDLSTLFITSASIELSEDVLASEPNSGRVAMIPDADRGRATNRMRL